jgi:hypothetical protein
MITICEPLCKGISHEKVNSGFIYGLSLAFPGEKIIFYADATHIEAIKNILQHDKISIDQIEYKTLNFLQLSSLLAVVMYFGLFSRLFIEMTRQGVNKVFFMSFNPAILYVIKKLKNKTKFSHLKFTLVLHGVFETVADDFPLPRVIALPRNTISNSSKLTLYKKLHRTKLVNLPSLIFRKLASKLPKFALSKRMSEFFTVKRMMELDHTDDYKYVALSPHAKKNAGKYFDMKIFDFHSVILPTIFVSPTLAPTNEYAKFAIFGYGDSLVLHNIANSLAQKQLRKPYEIRIIGMDDRGTEGFENVICTSKGKRLSRNEMEMQAKDVDAFLILYDKTQYRLSCSGSILESLSMVKPIIHFENDCINQFNHIENPIGFCCGSFDEYVNKLTDIIENYDAYKSTFSNFRENILKQRDICSIEKSLPQIRGSFSW